MRLTYFIFDLGDDYHLEILMTYVLNYTNRSPEEIKNIFKELDLNIDKNRIMNTLEMILKEGEVIGFKKGEASGIKKQKVFSDFLHLLRVVYKFPFWTIKEITDFTELKKVQVQAIVLALLSNKLENVHFMAKKLFFKEIEISKKEWEKIDKMTQDILNSDFMLRRKE